MSKQILEDNAKSLTLFAHRKAYIALVSIWGGLSAVAIAMIFMDPSFWQPAAINILALMGSLLWLRSFEVTVSDMGISQTSLFRRRTLLSWSEIGNAEIRVGYSGRYDFRDRLRSPFRLIIESHSKVDSRPIVINLKLLSEEDANRLIQTLNSRLPGKGLRLYR